VRAPALFCGAFLLIGLLFWLVPGIDLAASGVFYDPHSRFFLASTRPLLIVQHSIPWMTGGIIALVVIGTAWLMLTGRPLWRLDGRALAFIALATALGPGLLVNTVLKDHWGRARPYQVEQFGGTRTFTAAPLIADQCPKNCSFVSGHAALAFSLVGFAFLLPEGRRRRRGIAAAVGFGAVVSLARIAAGHHFLSDVVYAGFLVIAVSWLLHRWIVVHDGLGRPRALRFYRAAGAALLATAQGLRRLYERPNGRIVIWLVAVAAIEAVCILWVDRPFALYLHATDGRLRPFFDLAGRLGLGYPYLILFGLSFAALRWGGGFPRLQPHAGAMREAAAAPAFLFAAIAVSGLTVDLLKVIFGRARPKLLFASGTYDFGWLGWQADRWSFPSGHATTATALAVALWVLWPRHVLFYVAVALLVIASRIITGAHYLSDTVMGATIAIVTTRLLAAMFARHGFALGGRSARAV